MIREPKEGQLVWFVIPQDLSGYPVVLNARVICVNYDNVEVKHGYPHWVLDPSRLYSTKKKAKYAALAVLEKKIERMKSRTEEMERMVVEWKKRVDIMCVCEQCDVDELTLDKPCIEKA